MRKIIITVLAAMLLLALASTALAMGTKDFYVTSSGVKAYTEPDKHSSVLEKWSKGDLITFIDVSEDGKWYGYYAGEDLMGWIQKKYLSEDEPCDHEWSKWKVEKEATCTRTGLRTRYCKLCGEEQEETIEKEPHTYGKWKVVREATCTREGLRRRTCQVCGYEQESDIEMIPHTYGEWRTFIQPTDHSAGRRARVCSVCGYQENQDFDPEGTLRRGVRGEPVRQMQQLLVDQGYLYQGGADGVFGGGTETALMKFQRDQGLEPDGVAWPQTQKRLNHEFGPWTVTSLPTRVADGQRTRTCVDCGYQETEAIPAGPTLHRQDRGENVRFVQNMLNDLGYNAGYADGIYGGKLDSAFTAFAQARGYAFKENTVRPMDLDELMSAWLAGRTAESFKGSGDKTSPVQLTLTVTQREADGDLRTFAWTLTNLGNSPCTFKAILLGFGADHDFRGGGDIVLRLDDTNMRANVGNTLSGTFTACADWDKDAAGTFAFAALGVADDGAAEWLSNIVTLEE